MRYTFLGDCAICGLGAYACRCAYLFAGDCGVCGRSIAYCSCDWGV